MIFSRDKNGKTTVGDSIITVPKDQSFLSVMGTNAICNGDNFAEDYWVYNKGQRTRKWFKNLSDKSGVIWPPKLNDLDKLEAKRWKWHSRNASRYIPEWKKIQDRLRELGNVGGYWDNGPKACGWVQFEVYDDYTCWKWNDNKPQVINQEFVDWYFDFMSRHNTAGKRYSVINTAFLDSVDHSFQKVFWENLSESTLHLNINDRDYWFLRAKNYLDHFFEVLSLPEDTKVVKI